LRVLLKICIVAASIRAQKKIKREFDEAQNVLFLSDDSGKNCSSGKAPKEGDNDKSSNQWRF
jgi:hypothetical protein